MASIRTVTRALPHLVPRQSHATVRWASSLPGRRGRRRRGGGRGLKLLAVGVLSGAAYYAYDTTTRVPKEAPPPNIIIPKAEVEFETTATATPGGAAGDLQDISSQHRQIKRSLENPGVYAWGSNVGRAVAPDSTETVIKQPRRIAAFNGQLLRDLQLDRDLGVAVTEKGDVLQWGSAFWGAGVATGAPTPTLLGKNIVKVALSTDRIIALSANGAVYSLPASQSDQAQTAKAASSKQATGSGEQPAWWQRMLWSAPETAAPSSYRVLTPKLAWGERVVDVTGGLEHCLLLTSSGRVFSAVSSLVSYPARGQLGVPGLTWQTRPQGHPIDEPREVPGLRGIAAAQIATGDYHSLVLSRDGRIFGFGDNASGQLGVPVVPSVPFMARPVELPVARLYAEEEAEEEATAGPVMASARPLSAPRVTAIAAGGLTSFFTVAASRRTAGTTTSTPIVDTWACGAGLYGTLGTGRWTHISTSGPSKIKALSDLAEYSEAAGKMVPIGLTGLSAGTTHASAVLGNATHIAAPSSSEASWGSEVLWWGGNEFYQLGTGRRNNECQPVHINMEGDDVTPGKKQSAASKAAAEMTGSRERLELVPRATVRLGEGGKGRKVSVQQRVVCGRYVSGVYFST